MTDTDQYTRDMLWAVKNNCKEEALAALERGADINRSYADGFTALHYATQKYNQDLAVQFVKKGADVNAVDSTGTSSLHWAATKNNKDTAVLLLDHGARVNAANSFQNTALHWSAFHDCHETALVLLNHGIDIDAVNSRGSTALHTAAVNNSSKTVHLLLQHGASVNRVDENGNSALHLAAMNDRDETVTILIEHGADMNLANAGRRTPLHYAVNGNCKKAALILTNQGADVSLVGPHGDTLLHWAAENNNKELILLLIKYGADINAVNKDGNTILHWAAVNNPELVVFLIEHGANVNVKNQGGYTALNLASRNNTKIYLHLVDQGADVNAAAENGVTALHWAAVNNNKELALRLLAHSANVDAADKDKNTALHRAAESKSKEIAFLLMEHVADVNAVNTDGDTALNLAASSNSEEMSLQLLNQGADCNVVNKDGNSALHWAARYNNKELASLLLQHHADVNAVNDDGNTALHWAAKDNSESVARVLVEHGANVNTVEKGGNTALHFAADNNSKDISLLLVDHGANADAVNEDGNNALHLASNTNNKELVTVLVKTISDVNAVNIDGDTALHCTARGNNREVALVLLDYGANVNAVNKAGNTPLHCACMQVTGDATFHLLVTNGADTDLRNNNGLTALHYTVTNDDLSAAALLLEYGAKVNLTDKRGNSPLHLALSKKKFDFTSLFLKQPDVEVNKLDEDSNSLFHLLAQIQVSLDDVSETKSSITKIVRELSRRGASVNIRNLSDQTPLHLARNVCTAELLLENGAWPNAKELYSGNTPLLSRAKTMQEESAHFYEQSKLQKIVDRGMDPWIANDNGETVLGTLLTQTKDFQAARSLIHVMKGEDNGNINKNHSNGETLLHIVCSCEKDEALQLLEVLLESHAKVNALNAFSETPLQLVCKAIARLPEENITSTVYYWAAGQLMAHGADPGLQDRRGDSCIHIAQSMPQLHSLLTSPIDVAEIPPLLKWLEPKSHNHKSKVAEVVRGRMSIQVQTYHYHREPIGNGTFSYVYAGVDAKDGREVAVKRIEKERLRRPEDQREISSLVKLCNCEDVVRHYCCTEDAHFVYIILELMEGTLNEYLLGSTERKHDDSISITLCQDVVRGLRFFHQLNVLHRDIKPSNILYKISPRLCLKIADFGLSASANAGIEIAGVMHKWAGTRCWMAPELLQGLCKVADSFQSDVFASGLVLHYILDERKHPFAPAPENNNEKGIIEMQNETERNIMMHKLTISDLLTAEAQHLIGMMLNKEKESRPIAAAIIGHPLFWSKKKKIRFLGAVGNQPEFQAPRHIVREHSAVEKCLENSIDPTFATEPWDSLILPTYLEMTSSGGRRYDTRSVIDLVRFTRNALAHVSDTCHSIQFKHDVLESFVFLDKFPSLLIDVYKAITSDGWDTDRAEIKFVLFDD